MITASARVLRLLSLLQVRREWSGEELSARLQVHVRTIRRDVDRLRALGYTIDAESGPGGGYRLGAGATTPPLLLEDDEAVAVAVALGAAAGSIGETHDVALRVLAKLDQLLPVRLRRRLTALPAVTLPLYTPQTPVKLRVLAAIAAACRDTVQLRFAYRDRGGNATLRRVEPMRLVHTGRRWYLAAFDLERADWRTFRVDRVTTPPTLARGARFTPRQPPEDFATMVSRAISSAPYRVRARVRVAASAREVSDRLPPWMGAIESSDAGGCVIAVGGDRIDHLAAMIAMLGLDFTVLDPPELVAPLRAIAARLTRAAAAAAGAAPAMP